MSIASRVEGGSRLRLLRAMRGRAVARRPGASSSEEDRHGRQRCHDEQFRSIRAFHQFRLLLVSRCWHRAPDLGERPQVSPFCNGKSRARTQGALIPGMISYCIVTSRFSPRRRSGGARPLAEPLPFRPEAPLQHVESRPQWPIPPFADATSGCTRPGDSDSPSLSSATSGGST